MGRNSNKQNVSYLGMTKSGKYIHVDPLENFGFNKQDHLDAFRAHAIFIMHNQLESANLDEHRLAMNEHYLLAVNAD